MSTLSLTAQPQWKAVVLGQIKDRNQSQSNGYKDLIKLYNTALRKEKEIKDRTAALEKEVMTLRQENSGLRKGGGGGTSSGELSRQASSPELDARLLKLQEELTVSYKRNSDNAQLMIDLTKKMKETQEDNEKKDQEAQHFRQRLEEALLEQNRLKDKMEEEARLHKIMQDEMAALKVTHERVVQENTKLVGENQQLVDRWLKKMAEEAEKMNTANSFYEQMVQAHTRAELMNKTTNNQAPPPMPNAPVVKKSAFFESASFIDCSAILPSKPKRKISAHTDGVTCVAFSRSGLIVASGSTDKTVRLWDAPSGQSKTVLAGPTYSVMCVEFSPSDDTLLGASNDNACRIWGVDNCRLRHTLNGHVGKVLAARYADTQKVITGSHDRTIKLWDLTKGYCTRTVFCFSSLNDLAVAPDGALLMSGHIDHHLRFWDIKNGEVVHDLDSIHDNQITSVTISNDGLKVLSNSRDNTMKLVDIRTHEVVITLKDENYRNGVGVSRACLSPDGRYAAAGSMDGSLVIWNTLNGKVEKTIHKAHDSAILSCAWGPSGAQFASTGDKDKTLILWD